MKSNTLILLKAHFLNQSGINDLRYEKDKKKKMRVTMLTVVMAILGLMLAMYCFGTGYGLGSIGLTSIIPGYAFTITSLLILFFTVLKAGGILFAFKDYDMVMALPVPTTAVITSRFLLMYGMNVLFSLLVMIPMGIAYSLWAHPGVLFYVMWLIILFVTPLVPMTIATIAASIISAISSRFKHTNTVSIVLSFAVVIALMSASMITGTMNANQVDFKQLASLGTLLSEQMNQIYPFVGLIEKAVNQNNIIAFLSFLIISVVWYYLFVKIVSIKYKAINTGLKTYHAKSDYQLHSLKVTSPFNALYQKEVKRFFSSYLYVLNIGMGAVVVLVSALACFILGIEKIEQLVSIPHIKSMFIHVVPFMISAALSMTCTSAVSLSLEGKNLWILQSLPVEPRIIYLSKMAVNIVILLPVSLVSSLLISLGLKADLMRTVWLFITPLAYAGFTAVWGMFINLKMPNFTWESEVTVIKQSMSAVFGIFGGMLFGILPIGILFLLPGIDRNLLTGIITIIVIGITALLYRKVCKMKLPGSL